MNRQSIHQQIDSLLKIIREQHDQLKTHSGSIPQVELDFMIQNLRQLYEAAFMLNHTNALTSLDEIKAAVTQKILAEKRSSQIKQSQITEEEKELVATEAPAQQKAEKTVEETTAPPADVPVLETKTVKTPKKKLAGEVNTRFEDTPTIGDKFGGGDSVNKKLATQATSNTVAQKLYKNPIKDLTSAIGINEKFLFINNLFDGNLQNYSTAVERLNSVNDLTAAKAITSELSVQMNWDEGSIHVRHFIELVERRFS